MAMSRKDFVSVADSLRMSAGNMVKWGEISMEQYLDIVRSVSTQLGRNNVRVKSDIFVLACIEDVTFGSNLSS